MWLWCLGLYSAREYGWFSLSNPTEGTTGLIYTSYHTVIKRWSSRPEKTRLALGVFGLLNVVPGLNQYDMESGWGLSRG